MELWPDLVLHSLVSSTFLSSHNAGRPTSLVQNPGSKYLYLLEQLRMWEHKQPYPQSRSDAEAILTASATTTSLPSHQPGSNSLTSQIIKTVIEELVPRHVVSSKTITTSCLTTEFIFSLYDNSFSMSMSVCLCMSLDLKQLPIVPCISQRAGNHCFLKRLHFLIFVMFLIKKCSSPCVWVWVWVWSASKCCQM